MFDKTAELYDLIYSFKDYKTESEYLKDLILSHMPDCKTILDVACGTGEHHKFLKSDFQITGIDLDEKFVEIADQKNPECSYQLRNMVDFDLEETFDCIICMFSSIGYAGTYEKTISAFQSFAKHLSDDGILIVEPWLTPDKWRPNNLFTQSYEDDELHICRMGKSTRVGNISQVHFHYLIGKFDEDIKHLTEDHMMLMLDKDQMMDAFKVAGLKMDYDPEGPMGRGLYIGRLG